MMISQMSPNIRAAFWMIGAIASFTTMAIAGRAIVGLHDTFEIMFFRSLLGLGIVLGVGWSVGTLHEISTRRMGLQFIRNAAHFAGQNLWFYSLPLIPLAQLFALEFTSPIWVLLLAPLFLGESLTLRKALLAAIGFIGVLIVARPDFNAINIGLITGALAAIGFAAAAITTRMLTRTETLTCILFYLTLMQLIFGAIFVFWDGQVAWPNMQSLPWLILIGCAGLCAHYCMTTALAIAPASIVMPIDFARLPIVAVIGMIFYAEALEIYVFLGAGLIFLSNYLNLTQKQ